MDKLSLSENSGTRVEHRYPVVTSGQGLIDP